MSQEGTVRVLHFVGAMDHGGIEHFLMNVYRNIDRSKVQFDFMERVERDCVFNDEIRSLGGVVYQFQSPDKHPIDAKRYYRDFFQSHSEYGIAHFHRCNLGGFNKDIWAAFDAGVRRIILHSHSTAHKFMDDFPENVVREITHPLNRQRLDGVVTDRFACSGPAAEWMFPAKRNRAKDYRILQNGIDAEAFRFSMEARHAIRERYGIPQDAFVVGNVGRFSGAKNKPFLLDILTELMKKRSDAYLLLLGEGEQLADFNAILAKHPHKGRVVMAGVHSNTPDYYSAMDVFCMPSLYEGMPVVGPEAQASGLPTFLSTGIARETGMTSFAVFLNLSDGASEWAAIIADAKSEPSRRNAGPSEIRKAGYDVVETAKYLQEFYMKVAGR